MEETAVRSYTGQPLRKRKMAVKQLLLLVELNAAS